jgi:hypothetical protein
MLPNGLKGPMPDFSEQVLSDEHAHELYEFIIKGLAKPTRSSER